MSRNSKYRYIVCRLLFFAACLPALVVGNAHAQVTSSATKILSREQAGPLLPPSVFYKGQVAPVQTRNSAGLRFADTRLMLAALVDTSGYSTAVQQTYQGYLIVERPLHVGNKNLVPGAYGFGFVSGDRMVVMDIGGGEVLSTSTIRDANLQRPNPLQILPDPTSSTSFRLYLGRSYVTVQASK